MNPPASSDDATAGPPPVWRESVARCCSALAAVFVMLPLAIVALAVGGFGFGMRLHAWTVPAAMVLSALVAWRMVRGGREFAIVLVAGVLAHAAAFNFAARFFDGSWDGLDYQQEAVLRLAAGWNPWTESSAAYGVAPADSTAPFSVATWDARQTAAVFAVDHYSKGPWIAQAAVLLASDRLESAKLFNLTLAFGAGAMVAAVLLRRTRLGRLAVAGLTLLAAANPVSVCQSTSFYVDGWIAALVTVALAALIDHAVDRRPGSMLVACAAVALLVNVKFTGVLYAVLLVACALVAVLWRHGRAAGVRFALLGFVAGVVAVFVLGHAPYTRNWRAHGNPLFPLWGREALDIVTHVTPVNFKGRDRVSKFVRAMSAHSENPQPPDGVVRAKFPWQFDLDAASVWREPDVRAGGFGPLFFAMFLAALGVTVVIVVSPTLRRRATFVWWVAGAILLGVFAHGEGWWPRYAPQTWLLPLVCATAALMAERRSVRTIGWSIVLLGMANVGVIAFFHLREQRDFTRATRHVLGEMRAAPQPVSVHLANFTALRQRLREAGITFEILAAPAPDGVERHVIPSFQDTYWIARDP